MYKIFSVNIPSYTSIAVCTISAPVQKTRNHRAGFFTLHLHISANFALGMERRVVGV